MLCRVCVCYVGSVCGMCRCVCCVECVCAHVCKSVCIQVCVNVCRWVEVFTFIKNSSFKIIIAREFLVM